MQDADSAESGGSADIGTGLVARNLADMRAYISLANFTCALLPLCGPSMFKGWAYLMTLELVSASGQRPLLSGFYRMLKVTLALTAATGLLQAAGLTFMVQEQVAFQSQNVSLHSLCHAPEVAINKGLVSTA